MSDYIYYNANPFNKKTDDCVIRALSVVLDKPYFDVLDELVEISKNTGYSMCSDYSVDILLTRYGFVKQKQLRKPNNRLYKGSEFVGLLKNKMGLKGIYKRIYARVGTQHVVAIIDFKFHDIWDCSHEVVHTYYVKL